MLGLSLRAIGRLEIASIRLRDSVGMWCINDQCTGAVVEAHPMGGARASGTNDKAISVNVLLRFSSIRAVEGSGVSGVSGRK